MHEAPADAWTVDELEPARRTVAFRAARAIRRHDRTGAHAVPRELAHASRGGAPSRHSCHRRIGSAGSWLPIRSSVCARVQATGGQAAVALAAPDEALGAVVTADGNVISVSKAEPLALSERLALPNDRFTSARLGLATSAPGRTETVVCWHQRPQPAAATSAVVLSTSYEVLGTGCVIPCALHRVSRAMLALLRTRDPNAFVDPVRAPA